MKSGGRGTSRGAIAAVAGLGGVVGGAVVGASLLLRDAPPPLPPDEPDNDQAPHRDQKAERAAIPEPRFSGPAVRAEASASPKATPAGIVPPPVRMALETTPSLASEPENRLAAVVPAPVAQLPASDTKAASSAATELPPASPATVIGEPPLSSVQASVIGLAEPAATPAPASSLMMATPPDSEAISVPPPAPVAPPILADAKTATPAAVTLPPLPEPAATPAETTAAAQTAEAPPLPEPAKPPTVTQSPRIAVANTGARRVIPRRSTPPRPSHDADATTSQGPSSAPSRLVLPEPAFGGAGRVTDAPHTLDTRGTSPAAALGSAPPAPDGYGAMAPFTVDDELILQIQTRQGEISDTVTAYGTRAGVYLPLGEVARLLDLALVVSDEGQYAAGWVLDEKDAVAVNLREGTLSHGDKEVHIGPRDAAALDGELYLRADRFADLMPVTLKVDLRAQTITVTSLQPLPFEQRAAREAARERLGARGSATTRYPREETPWRALSFPLADVELRALSDTPRGTRAEGDLRLAGDVGFMTGQVFASGSGRDGLTAARIELGRRDPDARLLGPLHATEFEVGDVSTASLAMGLRGVGGRGATLSNVPLETASVFDKIDLRGELPDGYEAELYRNNTLIGSTRTPVNGQYEFLQVPVEFGLNVFRLVLYGPQGQRREDVRQISVGDGRLGKGELLYSLGMAQKDVNLLNVRGPDFVPGQDYGAWRATGQLQYGLSTALTTTLGGAWYESQGSRHWLTTAGLRTGLGSVAAQFDLGLNETGAKALEARLGGSIAGINWTATHAEYLGHFSDELRSFTIDPLRRASEADLNATLHLGSAAHPHAIPIAARVRRIAFADGRLQTDASLRASTLVSRLLVSNSMTFTQASSPDSPTSTQLTGSFDLASLSGSRTQYRAALGYGVLPHAKLTSAGIEVDRAFGPRTLVKASAARMLDTGDTTLGLSAIHRLGPFSLAFDSNVTVPDHTYSAVLRLGFSFGRNPLTGSLFMAQPGMASGGVVAVRAFEDTNGNQHFDPDEAPLADVEFDTGTLTGHTGRNGVALIGQLGDAHRTYLRLNSETLPDIALAPHQAGVEIVPRPGRVHVSQFAVDALGDLEGTAYFGDNRQAVSGLVLRLIDAKGKPAARTRTASGGVFLFEQLHPGEYHVELDPGQAGRLGLRLAPGQSVRVGGSIRTARVDVQVLKDL